MSSFERLVRQHGGENATDEEIVKNLTIVSWVRKNARIAYVPEHILKLLDIKVRIGFGDSPVE